MYRDASKDSISVEDVLFDIFKKSDTDHLLVGDFLAVCLYIIQYIRRVILDFFPFHIYLNILADV